MKAKKLKNESKKTQKCEESENFLFFSFSILNALKNKIKMKLYHWPKELTQTAIVTWKLFPSNQQSISSVYSLNDKKKEKIKQTLLKGKQIQM